MAGVDNLKPFVKGDDRASLAGQKSSKKGSKHINTWVQEILHDENFEGWVKDPKEGVKLFHGAPVQAIIKAQLIKAMDGDTKAFDSLIKSGYVAKQEIQHSGEIDTGNANDALATGFAEFLKNKE